MLEAYLPYFSSRYGADVEFVVVINGSTDKTDEVVASYAAQFPCVRAIVEPDPIGKGGALIVGMRAAHGDFIGFVDADGATQPEAFQDLMDSLGEAGGIIASRWAKGSQVSPRQPLDRRVASRAFNFLTRCLFGLRLTDTQCGAKLMRREAVEAILPHLGITQWAFDVDLLFQLRRAGFRIKEIPTVWHDVAGSKIQVGKASSEMILALTRLRLLYSPFRWVVGLYDRFIGPWVHPEGVVRDYLLTHSLMLFVGAQFGNLCNLVFQMAMMPMLGNVEYGVLSAMLGALMMVGMPLGALTGAVTHFTSHFMGRDEREKIKGMMVALGRDLLLPGLAFILVAIYWKPQIMGALKLASPWPVYAMAATLVVMLLGAIPGGVLAGMQAFEWAALIGNGWTVVRLALGIVLVLLGLGAAGALGAHMAGLLAAGIFSMVICVSLLGRGWGAVERPAGIYSYMGGYMAAYAAYGILASADVLLVKYFFSGEQAGIFAKAAMVARIVFYLPGPVGQAMFPKVTSTGDSSAASRRTLEKALVVAGAMVAGVCVVAWTVPGVLLRVLAREVQPGQVEIVRGMVLALAPLTLLQLLLNYELAQRRFGIMAPLYLCAGAYLLGVWRWHAAPLQVVVSLGVASGVALALCLMSSVLWRAGKDGREDVL